MLKHNIQKSIPIFDCLEMDDGFILRIHESPSWHVHSAFRRVINLASDNLMITLASKGNTLMPYTIICSATDFRAYEHLKGQPVIIQKNCLFIDQEFGIYLDGKVSSSQYKPFIALNDPNTLGNNIRFLENRFRQQAAMGSFFNPHDASLFTKELQRTLLHNTVQFCMAVQKRDLEKSTVCAKSLIGLGVGLTPSGDDYLVGFFAVLLLMHSKSDWFVQLIHAALDDAEQRTNEISATYLNSLKECRLKKEIADLISAVCTQGTDTIQLALDALLQIGSTSGTDVAKGIIDSFNLSFMGDSHAVSI